MRAPHAAGSWDVHIGRGGWVITATQPEGGQEVARTEYSGFSGGADAANARRIVQCVNAHDDLLAALRGIMAGVAGCEKDPKYEAARAAIAKATGVAP